jgi:hypothetical protein
MSARKGHARGAPASESPARPSAAAGSSSCHARSAARPAETPPSKRPRMSASLVPQGAGDGVVAADPVEAAGVTPRHPLEICPEK